MARKRKNAEARPKRSDTATDAQETEIRIIGGKFRGRRLRYHGDPVVRPMKHRTREAIFNLISTECGGRHAIDLFAGTGALGLEALSRGAASATFIEKHVPTARIVEENIHTLGVVEQSRLLVTSAFLWAKRDLPSAVASPPTEGGWLVFCSPPYAFYTERKAEMFELIERVQQYAPPGSILIVEADEQFDFDSLLKDQTSSESWDRRVYSPAVVGIWRNTSDFGGAGD
jgi:16S rRNA (guanine966-N2)-methyltransferase